MKILVACEESQIVTTAFRRKGHEAFSCDILQTSGIHTGWHLKMDVFKAIKLMQWDMMIAFPPCTHLAVSGAKHFEQKRKDGRQQQGIDFFMALTETNIPIWAIENPIGIMSKIYRKPDQIIQPYMFGDPVKKSTCLWLHGLPLLVPTNNVEAQVKYYIDKKGTKQSEWNVRQLVLDGKKYGYDSDEFKKHRSKTFKGVAEAMAEQWSTIPVR